MTKKGLRMLGSSSSEEAEDPCAVLTAANTGSGSNKSNKSDSCANKSKGCSYEMVT